MWHQLAAEDTVAGGYGSDGMHEHTDFYSSLARVKKKQQNKLFSTKRLLCWGDQKMKSVCLVRSM
jgi:hypothetical protein